MQKTSIEYLDYSYNPIKMRCTPVSAGCTNCWHLAMAKRLANNPSIYADHQRAYKGGPPVLDLKELEAPLHLRKPARIGVQFMGDLFHESIDRLDISAVLGAMEQCPKHKFFILTKRPERFFELKIKLSTRPNLYFGVSIEDQPTADERLAILLQIPATHRWVSVEPMLEAVDVSKFLFPKKETCICDRKHNNYTADNPYCRWPHGKDFLDWIVLGGETGPKARPLHPDWVRSVRDQCESSGVKFYFKSWGTPSFPNIDISDWLDAGYQPVLRGLKPIDQACNNYLDGREWNEMP